MKRSWIFGGILLLGLALRLWGISFGLPEVYHADEPIVVNHALAYGTGDFNPHFFKIPPLVSYLLFGIYGLYYLIARGAGGVSGIHDFQLLFLTDPGSFYLLARLLFGALAGTLTIFVFYKLISKEFSKDAGLLSAFFLAAAFLPVRDSHYIYVDIPLLLTLGVSFFPLFEILKRGSWRAYLLFGILAGLSVATKYNGVLIFIPFGTAHLLRNTQQKLSLFKKEELLKVLAACFCSGAAYTLLNPYTWLDFKLFWQEISIQAQASQGVSPWHPLVYSLHGGMGAGLLGTGIGGLIGSVFERDRKKIMFSSFIVGYYLLLIFRSQPYDRYALPLIPFLVFFSGDFLIKISKQLRIPKRGVAGIALLVAAPSLTKGVLSNQIFVEKDVRTVAREWVERAIPAGTRLALDIPFFMPRFKMTESQLEEKKKQLLKEGGDGARLKRIELLLEEARQKKPDKRYELYFLKEEGSEDKFLLTAPSVPYRIEDLKKKDIRYVLVATIHEKQNPDFYQALGEEGKLLQRWTPYRDPSRKFSMDRQPLTGGPFLWSELIARKRNGEIIELYELN